MKNRSFRIQGLCCASEVNALKREVGPCVGGEDGLAFDILRHRMTVQADPARVSDAVLMAAVRRAGLEAEPWTQPGEAPPQPFSKRHGRVVLTAVSGVCMFVALIMHAVMGASLKAALSGDGDAPMAVAGLYVISILAGVRYVVPKAWAALRAMRPDMNLLMVIAVAGAVMIGEWFEAATVAFLFAVALLLESWSVGRARRAVSSLLETAPPIARWKQPTGTVTVAPEAVPVGSIVIVRPGEKIPLDGEVVAGRSDVNQAPITGESVPVAVQPGDPVFAGTINGDGLIEVRSSRDSDHTTLAHILRLVTEAQSRRSPSEQWVERFARVYTPLVLALAAMVFVLPPLLVGAAWSHWFYRALVLLVIACPCALVISTPVSIVAALTRSAAQGVLVKGGVFMEAPAHLRAIAFDKTGTLTEGRLRVTRLVPLDGHSEDELLMRAASLEAGSNHPLAEALLREASARRIDVDPAEAHRAIPGRGVTGRLAGGDYWLGSHRYLVERGQANSAIREQLDALADAGHTVVVVGNDRHVCGLIALADQPRAEARAAMDALHRLGIKPIVMLTGDNASTAQAIADALGVDQVYAGLLPEDKVERVEHMVADLGRTAMVGDGVNDAPALAVASLGIAMGAAGSDAAIETADIALMTDDLRKLPWLVAHARRTLAVIRQNIMFALGLKILFVILTLLGMATLWMAIAADMGASLLVIFNGLRLLNGARR